MTVPALIAPHGWPAPACARVRFNDASSQPTHYVCWTCWTWLTDTSRFLRSGQAERNVADAYRPEGIS